MPIHYFRIHWPQLPILSFLTKAHPIVLNSKDTFIQNLPKHMCMVNKNRQLLC
uniref:Uncharacterized protein n=1 Tax=Rhizophora mucronata TaxID=61149 RepID=A0A2P2PQ66_RHIMU